MKLTPNGVLDPTFDGASGSGNGIVTFTAAEIPEANDMLNNGIIVMPDGDLLTYGYFNDAGSYTGFANRFTSNGVLDTTFGGGDGQAEYLWGVHTYFENAVLQPDGKVVFAGWEWTGDTDWVITRILPDGSLDPAFDGPGTGGGGNGLFWVPDVAGQMGSATGVTIADDGDIVVVGGTASGGDDVYSMRFESATGAFDTSWDGPTGTGDGKVRYTLTAGSDWGNEILTAPTGELYVVGTTSPGGVGLEPLVMRLLPNGSPDPTFDGASGTDNGAVRVTATAADDEVMHATFGVDGDLVIAGTTDAATDVLRVTRMDGLAFTDYDDDDIAPADQNWSEGSAFFGICLRAFTGTSAVPTWSVNATCAADDTGTHWRAVPVSTGPAKVGQIGGGGLDGSASFRFAARVPTAQSPGIYAAPITFEVVAPAA